MPPLSQDSLQKTALGRKSVSPSSYVEEFSEQLCVIAVQLFFNLARTQLQLLRYLLIALPIGALPENGIVKQLISPLPFHQPNVLTALGKAFAAVSTLIPLNFHS